MDCMSWYIFSELALFSDKVLEGAAAWTGGLSAQVMKLRANFQERD